MMEFYDDPVKVDEYEAMCKQYDGSAIYKVLAKYLSNNSTLLELGSGPGNDISYFRQKYAVTGSDTSNEFLLRCKSRFRDIPFLELDAVSIETNKVFGCIFSNNVLHHLTQYDLRKSLKRQQKVIVKDGVFAHSFWLGDREFEMEGMLFVFYDRENLIEMVSNYFTVVENFDYMEFEESDSIFIVAKNDKAA